MVLTSFGLAGSVLDVEDVDLAVVEAARPEKAAVVAEAGVVRFAASAHGNPGHDLAELRRLRVDVERDELVGAVAHAFHAQGPDVQIIFLALDQVRQIGGVAGFVGQRRGGMQGQEGKDDGRRRTAPRESSQSHHVLRISMFLGQSGANAHRQRDQHTPGVRRAASISGLVQQIIAFSPQHHWRPRRYWAKVSATRARSQPLPGSWL
jgi:hypothetical protein